MGVGVGVGLGVGEGVGVGVGEGVGEEGEGEGGWGACRDDGDTWVGTWVGKSGVWTWLAGWRGRLWGKEGGLRAVMVGGEVGALSVWD